LKGFGSDEEPYSSIWMASLSNGMGSFFKEGLKVLDYGCGAARYANFLSMRLKDFKYYGLEVKGGTSEKVINDLVKPLFQYDKRIELGTIEEKFSDVIKEVDVVLLGSVFTHISFDFFKECMRKFEPVLKRKGCVVFSVFLTEEEHFYIGKNGYGLENCYSRAFYNEKIFNDYLKNKKVVEVSPFVTTSNDNHRIFRVENNELFRRKNS